MATTKFSLTIGIMLASVLILVACSPVASTTVPEQSGSQSEPGAAGEPSTTNPAGSDNGTTSLKIADTPAGQSQPGNASVSDYKFTVTAPTDFVLRSRNAEQLAVLDPKPVAAFMYMNPDAANSQASDEPGDLEVRVYDLGGASTLDAWLKANGFSAGVQKPTEVNAMYVPNGGVKVCLTTMLAPNCFYYFITEKWVYSVFTMTQAGDEMLKTFALVP